MRKLFLTALALAAGILYAGAGLHAAQPGEALLEASSFASAEAASAAGWEQYAQRAGISPEFSVAQGPSLGGPGSLALYGASNAVVRGCWRNTVKGVEAGKFYNFEASFAAQGVDYTHNTVFARLDWLDAKGAQAGQRVYVPELDRSGPWQKVGITCRAPENAVAVRVELFLSQNPQARAFWDEVRLIRAADPPHRPVRLATVNCRPGDTKTPAESVEQFCAVLDQAGQQKADIVCLGEGVNMIGTYKEYDEIAEPIPGPTTERLGELARKYRMYVVAALGEREGQAIYNTAVLIDRQGKVAGKYRKVYIPEGEFDQGVAQGDSYPVFDTDFGRIGIMICWDSWFVDPARALSLQGAEVIFLPIWGGNQTMICSRAMENHAFLVNCGYDCSSRIYGPWGELLAEAKERPSVVTADIDLNYPPACPFPWPLPDTRLILLQSLRNDIHPPALER